MALPIIGITCDLEHTRERFFLRSRYLQAVTAAGGLPLILPPVSPELAVSYVGMIQGLLLTGGGDIEPSFFGARPLGEQYKVLPERDAFEIALTREALRAEKPVLAICRGIQVLNVAAGGDLYRDIKTEVTGVLEHSQKEPREQPVHTVEITAGSRLESILGPRSMVNSLHHQALKKVAPGLKVTARAPDGIIEAVEGSGYIPVIGVQWHPEELCLYDSRQQRIFDFFIGWIRGNYKIAHNLP